MKRTNRRVSAAVANGTTLIGLSKRRSKCKGQKEEEIVNNFSYNCSTHQQHHNRSQSVPEDLSTLIQQQCTCKPQPIREFIYLPKNVLIEGQPYRGERTRTTTTMNPLKEPSPPNNTLSTIPRYYKHKRSYSLPRCSNVQFVEQITTSV